MLIAGLFADAAWYQQGGGQFPDGLPPYAHSPYYLELFAIVLQTVNRKQAADQARHDAGWLAAMRGGRTG